MSSIISISGVSKSFGDVAAVRGVSLDVQRGELFGILGPNGAGKTTLLGLVEGLQRADGGTIEVLGMAPWPRNPDLAKRIGVQLQSTALFSNLTVHEQIATFARLYGAHKIERARVEEVIDLVDLREKRDTRTAKLSGGQAQRLSIALALVHKPELVILDEPSAALDPRSRRALWDVILAIREAGATVVLTTHNMDEAEHLCDRVALMNDGQIVALDTPVELASEFDATTTVSVAAATLSLVESRTVSAVVEATQVGSVVQMSTTDVSATVSALAIRGALEGLSVRGASLEDVFLAHTGRTLSDAAEVKS
ncbi:MAG: ABC transporter ATP-binding protein [Thermoleophilia bacterium]|nr:ABC transporter ATP-binding protein [Thermoleophilia bacterium]